MDLGRWQHWLIIHYVQIQQRKPVQCSNLMFITVSTNLTNHHNHLGRFISYKFLSATSRDSWSLELFFYFFKRFSGNTHALTSFGIRHPFEGEKSAKDHSSLDPSTKCCGSEQREQSQFSFWGTDTCGSCGLQCLHQVPSKVIYKTEICFLDT